MTSAGHPVPTAATLRRRLSAFGVDYLAIAAYIGALWGVSTALASANITPADASADPVRGQLMGFALLTLPVLLYFALWEGSARQATPGKWAFGLTVVSSGGGRLPWSRSLLRSSLKFLPWELAHTSLWRIPGWPAQVETIPAGPLVGLVTAWILAAAYVVAALLSTSRRTPYDRAAGSTVVQA
jgi:uncharacterized RDD family membrane protein YckC